jgi:hypothetical protein
MAKQRVTVLPLNLFEAIYFVIMINFMGQSLPSVADSRSDGRTHFPPVTETEYSVMCIVEADSGPHPVLSSSQISLFPQ